MNIVWIAFEYYSEVHSYYMIMEIIIFNSNRLFKLVIISSNILINEYNCRYDITNQYSIRI